MGRYGESVAFNITAVYDGSRRQYRQLFWSATLQHSCNGTAGKPRTRHRFEGRVFHSERRKCRKRHNRLTVMALPLFPGISPGSRCLAERMFT